MRNSEEDWCEGSIRSSDGDGTGTAEAPNGVKPTVNRHAPLPKPRTPSNQARN